MRALPGTPTMAEMRPPAAGPIIVKRMGSGRGARAVLSGRRGWAWATVAAATRVSASSRTVRMEAGLLSGGEVRLLHVYARRKSSVELRVVSLRQRGLAWTLLRLAGPLGHGLHGFDGSDRVARETIAAQKTRILGGVRDGCIRQGFRSVKSVSSVSPTGPDARRSRRQWNRLLGRSGVDAG